MKKEKENEEVFCYCIYYWNKHGDLNEVEIDSIWMHNDDAIARMKILRELEEDYLKNDNQLNKKYSSVDYQLIMNDPDGSNIRRIKKNGTWDSSMGYFCERVTLDNNQLLLNNAINHRISK